MVITGAEVVVVGNVIIQIINLANNAQICQNSCREFKEYIESIQVPVDIIMKTNDVMGYSETKRHMKRLIHLLNDSKSLLKHCNDKKWYQKWFRIKPSSIPGKLTGKRDKIKERFDLVKKGLVTRKKAEAEAKKKAEAEAEARKKAEAKKKAEAEARKKAEAKRKAEAEAKKKAEAARKKAARKKEETRYRDLLTQKITDCQASWTKSEAKLENFDIDRERRETMFREHVAGLLKVAKGDYRLLLKEVIGKEKRMSWDHAKQKLEKRTKYKNLPQKERRELFDEYVKRT